MPGPLKDVEQRVGLDASNYHSESLLIVRDNVAMGQSFDNEVIAKLGQVEQALGRLPDSKSVRITADTASALASIAAVDAALNALSDREVTVRVRYVTEGAPPDAGPSFAAARSAAGSAGDGGVSAAVLRQMQDTSASFDRVNASLGRVEDHLAGIRADLATARSGGGQDNGGAVLSAAAASLAGAAAAVAASKAGDQGTTGTLTAATNLLAQAVAGKGSGQGASAAIANAAMATAAMNAGAGRGSSSAGNAALLTAAAQAVRAAPGAAAASGASGASGSSSGAAAAGAVLGSAAARSGGSGGAAAAALAAAASGGGGTPGGGGAAPLSFNPLAAGGGLGAVRFWGMAGAEIAATVIPAMIAGASAALVGLQGGQQVFGRYKSIYSTASAIGPAYGQTAGSYIVGGPNGSALQNAQNAATGGVYELAGAGINLLRTGAGNGLMTQGVGTVAMIDRAAANAVINFQQNGTGAKLASATAGGTNYLRQFGAIAGNLGNTALDVAPYLPGMGSDLLSTLMGGSGLLARGAGMMTNSFTGPAILGPLLAAEAASRWGPGLLSGSGLIGKALGLSGVGGIGGLIGKGGTLAAMMGLGSVAIPAMTSADIADILAATGVDLTGTAAAAGAAGAGVAGLLGDAGAGITSLGLSGGMLGGLLGPLGLMGAGGYGLWKLANIQAGTNSQMAGMQSKVNAAGFTQAWQPLSNMIVQSYKGAASPAVVKSSLMMAGIGLGGGSGGAYATNPGLIDAAGASWSTGTMANLVNAGPQLVKALQSGPNPLTNVSTAQAYQIAQLGLLGVGNAFIPGTKNLTPTAVQQLQNYGSGIRPMTGSSGGAFEAGVAGQYIMSQSAMKNVSSLNQAMDSLTTIMEGGATGVSGLSATAGGLGTALGAALNPLTAAQAAAGQTQGPASMAQIAKALTSFSGTGSAAAWSAFASNSTANPGVITQLQQQIGTWRTGLALNAWGSNGARAVAGLTGYEAQPFLAAAQNSPAALSMLMQQMVQGGVTASTGAGGYYNTHASQAQNFAAAQAAIKKYAFNATQASQATTQYTTGTANLPATAATFAGQQSTNLTSALVADASNQVLAIRNSALGGKIGQVSPGAVKAALADFQSSGLSGGALKGTFNAALKQAGVSQNMIMTIDVKYNIGKPPPPPKGGTVTWKSVLDKPQLPPAPHPPPVQWTNHMAKPQALPAPKGSPVIYPSLVTKPQAPPPPFGGTVYYNSVVNPPGGRTPGTSATAAGAAYPTGMQTGGLVPGSGSGDIIPAMLEPGEAIVPRYLVPLIAPFLTAHRVPGFGAPSGASHNFAAGGVAQATPLSWTVGASGPQLPLPSYVQKVLDQILQSVSTSPVWHQFGITLTGKMESSIKNLPSATHSLAAALVSKLTTEVGYANSVASAAKQGNGYGTQGLISGYNVTPGTGGGTVYEQMQSYLASEKSFTTDIASLRKGGLNKALIAQMIAAGPVQGDALAQSVMGSYGGIKGVNQLWTQIEAASTALGAQAAMAKYPGSQLSPTLQSGTIVNNNVSISIGGQGAGGLNLSAAQIKALTEIIQAELLKQARRNQKTGVKAHGKSA